MRGEILEADDKGLARWAEFLAGQAEARQTEAGQAGAGLYCQPLWLRFLARVYGFRVRLAVCAQGGEILAGTPLVETRSVLFGHRLCNNPFSLYADFPCARPEAAAPAVAAAQELTASLGARALALRLNTPLPDAAAALPGLCAHQNRVLPLLPLGPNYDEVFARYKKQFRTNLRKCRQGIEADPDCKLEVSTDEAGYRRFHPVLLRLFRDKHAMFPAPLRHFLALPRLLGPERARLYTFIRRGEPVAGMVILLYGERAYYSWSASLPQADALDAGAYLLDSVVRDLCALGLRELDLGVTSPSSTALLFFKGRFGAHMARPWHYHFSPSGSPLRDMSAETSLKGPRSVLKLAPLPLFKLAGTLLYRHLA